MRFANLTVSQIAGRRGGSNGHLYIALRVADHPLFRRDGEDVHIDGIACDSRRLFGLLFVVVVRSIIASVFSANHNGTSKQKPTHKTLCFIFRRQSQTH
jgi:hypothetical protein